LALDPRLLRSFVVLAEGLHFGRAAERLNVTQPALEEQPTVTVVYGRPQIAHWLACPFCQGFWVSLAVYLAWVFEPRWTLYAVAPFAISAAVGLIARNLDP
jgi:hypothetical protein